MGIEWRQETLVKQVRVIFKYFLSQLTLRWNLRILIGCFKSCDLFQPIRKLEFHRPVNWGRIWIVFGSRSVIQSFPSDGNLEVGRDPKSKQKSPTWIFLYASKIPSGLPKAKKSVTSKSNRTDAFRSEADSDDDNSEWDRSGALRWCRSGREWRWSVEVSPALMQPEQGLLSILLKNDFLF